VPDFWAGSCTGTVAKTGLGTVPLLLLDGTCRGGKLERLVTQAVRLPTNAVVSLPFFSLVLRNHPPKTSPKSSLGIGTSTTSAGAPLISIRSQFDCVHTVEIDNDQ
jgi:hypothetical protein